MEGFLPLRLIAAAEGGHHGPNLVGLLVYLGAVVAIMFGLMAAAKGGLNQRVFRKPLTSCFEQLYLFLENMCVGTIGPHGRRYLPILMSLWMVIFTSNLLSLFFASAPTADFSFNLALALITVGYVQYEGIRANGLFGHLSHFAGPKLGGLMVIVSGMIFVIEIISEVMKNLSLSLRLYGNIDGGHRAVEAMNSLSAIPFGYLLIPIKLLTCVVQAMIFTLLTCVYLSLVTHHEDDHGAVDAGDTDPHQQLAHAH
jgi:F-type H+-transporting ATPase subunit a